MHVLLALLLLLWPVDPEPGRASLATVKQWNAATVASLRQQLQRPEFDNARYYMALRLPEFDSVTTARYPPFRLSFRLNFLQFLERTYPQTVTKPFLVLEYFSQGEMNVLRNALVSQQRGRTKVTFFRYRYGWIQEGSQLFSGAEAQQLAGLSHCYEQGRNHYELVVTQFPLPGHAIQSAYFVEHSLCSTTRLLTAFEQVGQFR